MFQRREDIMSDKIRHFTLHSESFDSKMEIVINLIEMTTENVLIFCSVVFFSLNKQCYSQLILLFKKKIADEKTVVQSAKTSDTSWT